MNHLDLACVASFFSHSNFVGEFSASASMTLPVTKKIFVTVEISKFSICSSWSCVNVPSRRLNLMSCVRATSLASLRAALVSFPTFTLLLSNFLSTRAAFQISFHREAFSRRFRSARRRSRDSMIQLFTITSVVRGHLFSSKKSLHRV